MKSLIFIIYLVSMSLFAFSQTSRIDEVNFKRGEILEFKLYYKSAITGNVSAGELVSKVQPNWVYIENHASYHITLEGKTKGAFNWFFKIRDKFESYVDEHTLTPHFFRKEIQEGDYRTKREVRFNQNEGMISYHNLKNGNKGKVHTELKVQDLVSSLYYIRNWNFNDAYKGKKYQLNVFLDDSVYHIQFEYIGLKNVKTSLGKIQCLAFKPRMLTGGVFADESPMTVYVSNDKNHIPILVISEVMVGSVRMELKDYSGLAYPLAIK